MITVEYIMTKTVMEFSLLLSNTNYTLLDTYNIIVAEQLIAVIGKRQQINRGRWMCALHSHTQATTMLYGIRNHVFKWVVYNISG